MDSVRVDMAVGVYKYTIDDRVGAALEEWAGDLNASFFRSLVCRRK